MTGSPVGGSDFIFQKKKSKILTLQTNFSMVLTKKEPFGFHFWKGTDKNLSLHSSCLTGKWPLGARNNRVCDLSMGGRKNRTCEKKGSSLPLPRTLYSFLCLLYLFDQPPWALIKFLDLESGRLFKEGAYSRLGAYWIFSISASVVCLFCNKTMNGNDKTQRCNKARFL